MSYQPKNEAGVKPFKSVFLLIEKNLIVYYQNFQTLISSYREGVKNY